MGVKTALGAISFTATGKTTAVANGTDLAGMIAECQLGIQEIQNKLNYLIADVLTPAGTEAANITTINTQLTNLS